MRKHQGRIALLFLLPYFIFFILFRFGPSVAGLLVGFTKWDIVGQPTFIGLQNYVEMFADPLFYTSLINTLLFLVIAGPILTIGSLLLAILVNMPYRGRNFTRSAIFMPYVIIPAVIGIIWNWIYETNFGILNYYLGLLHVSKVGWLTDSRVALVSVALATVWWLMGYNMVIFLAGVQNISRDLYEAARIDGAGRVQLFFHVTLPMLKPVTSIVVTMTMINIIQMFDQIYVMTGGGPGTATLTLVQYMYNKGFQSFQLGFSSAVSVIILLLLVAIVLLQSKVLNVKEEG